MYGYCCFLFCLICFYVFDFFSLPAFLLPKKRDVMYCIYWRDRGGGGGGVMGNYITSKNGVFCRLWNQVNVLENFITCLSCLGWRKPHLTTFIKCPKKLHAVHNYSDFYYKNTRNLRKLSRLKPQVFVYFDNEHSLYFVTFLWYKFVWLL